MYPSWSYYPRNVRPPSWAEQLVRAVSDVEALVSTVDARPAPLRSDDVLQALAPGLTELGYAVETGKTAAGRIKRPVLFGENGEPSVSYEIDAFHDHDGIVVEVEAGRGARGNANYRDIVRTSLIVDAHYLALLMPVAYRHKSGGRDVVVRAYADTRSQLDAIYASERLKLPFAGVLLVGY
ncbi:hypothetical protein [Pseudonocardia alni]|uniref:Restriction endonuclease BglII n=1 Tax=Pseudonocardia alni TaxID=33907 RepID=A0AA44ZR48_PSEA5|nr:hypothetical protein [Pseudonocardia alni]PKB32454.1 hypothetical protein ATL51_4183 [Pseudonocardia alni]